MLRNEASEYQLNWLLKLLSETSRWWQKPMPTMAVLIARRFRFERYFCANPKRKNQFLARADAADADVSADKTMKSVSSSYRDFRLNLSSDGVE